MSQYLVFSHGFGVKKDDRGLLTDIAEALSDYQPILFDYNDVDETNNVLTVLPLSEQARLLNKHINRLRDTEEGAQISLVCHSQGCVAAALANPTNLKQVVFLTPPGNVSAERVKEFFGKRQGTVVEDDGTLRVPRRDGSTTRIPPAFLDDMFGIDVTKLYTKFADANKLTVIIADQDEVLKPIDFNYLESKANILHIDGDHNFTGKYRGILLDKLKQTI